jgi:hypothetical protein
VPGEGGREAVKGLMLTPSGRDFLVYVNRLSMSWDMLMGDRTRVREMMDEQVSSGDI